GGVALFRREGRNLIDWVREGSEDPWQAQNVAQMRTSGLEVDLRFAPVVGRLPQVEMGYAFLSSDKRTEGWESKYVLDYLMHQFSVGVAHPLISGWRGDWKLRYERRVGGEGHFILDLKVSGRPKGLEVFLECTNILNTSYTETGGVPMPGRWITGGLGFVF
ncbi:MAG TPA: TonB-dependent receptor, partial [Candidatus Latescibacteria bacterium]|nr:TonB-dependent receptor [Candidatus Latescibacterota bacterium]